MSTVAERKYAMTRLGAGDYLLPSNDGQTIWRIRTYRDGPSHGLDVEWSDRTFWGVWKWRGNVERVDTIDPDDGDQWEEWDYGMYKTRADAIRAALR